MAESKSKSKSVTKKKVAKKQPNTKISAKKTARKKDQLSDTPDTPAKNAGLANPALSHGGSHVSSQESSHANSPVERQSPPTVGQTDTETGQVEAGSAAGHNVVSWMALLLSGLALSVAGVVWYLTAAGNIGQQDSRFNTRFNMMEQRVDEFVAMQTDNSNAVSQLESRLIQSQDGFGNRIKTLQSEIIEQKSATEQTINAQANDFRQKLNTLSDSMVKLRAEQGRGIDSRRLEQAEQLIFMANQQVQFAGQFSRGNNLAKHALQDADALLQKLADPALNRVRQLLTTEMAMLDNVAVVDVIGVLNTLSALSSTVENLALAGDIVIAEKTNRVTSGSAQSVFDQPEAEVSGMARYMQPIIDAGASFLSSMGDLIQVEKNGKSVKPIISAEVRQITYQKTKLILESAQIAFIRQQPALYQHQIQRARSWVEENFAQNADETVNWLARLDEVGSIPQSNIPDISESLKAIRNIIENRNRESVGVGLNKAE